MSYEVVRHVSYKVSYNLRRVLRLWALLYMTLVLQSRSTCVLQSHQTHLTCVLRGISHGVMLSGERPNCFI